jgi:hypothetical protein
VNLPSSRYWIPDSVANILHSDGVRTRAELASRIDLGRSIVYRCFAEDWSGRATMTVLVRAAAVFGVPLAKSKVEHQVAPTESTGSQRLSGRWLPDGFNPEPSQPDSRETQCSML